MYEIILDMGSGLTCQNKSKIVKQMIDSIPIEPFTDKYKIVLKWQLWSHGNENIFNELVTMERAVFDFAYYYAQKKGFEVSASVFDEESLMFLEQYDIPWVKIANNPKFYDLALKIKNNVNVYISNNCTYIDKEDNGILQKLVSIEKSLHAIRDVIKLFCVSKYPAIVEEYEKVQESTTADNKLFMSFYDGVSDHTVGLDLFKRHKPKIYEKHYKLESQENIEAGSWCLHPKQIKELIKYMEGE